jgi:hypothetical protein
VREVSGQERLATPAPSIVFITAPLASKIPATVIESPVASEATSAGDLVSMKSRFSDALASRELLGIGGPMAGKTTVYGNDRPGDR